MEVPAMKKEKERMIAILHPPPWLSPLSFLFPLIRHEFSNKNILHENMDMLSWSIFHRTSAAQGY
jgi:membrane associated rhomboid family serine protease